MGMTPDQILGHPLINSRDAYSLPTDEELKEAYIQAYQFIRIYDNKKKTESIEVPNIEGKAVQSYSQALKNCEFLVAKVRTMPEVKQLLSMGYKFEMEYDGATLFKKAIENA